MLRAGDWDETTYDPVALEIIWSRLVAIVDEASKVLVRSAFSPIVRESNDYACVLMDADGNSLAESTYSIPCFNATLPETMKHFLARFPKETWQPGDMVITNDPWMGTGHLPDFTLAAPVFYKGRLVAFAGSIAHVSDIGGTLLGADCQEVFEEGLRIPISKLVRQGEVNAELLEIITANVRVPEQVTGDLYAQIVATELCAERLLDLMQEQGLEDLTAIARITQGLAEQAMRKAIAAVPEGTYRHAITVDGHTEPLRIAAAVTVRAGEILVDYTGTAAEIRTAGINCPMCYTYAYTAYPIKCAVDPATPKNGGSYRPIKVVAPAGSVVNPRFPVAVNARHLTGHCLSAVVYGALAQAMPGRVVAESGSAPLLRGMFAGTGLDGRRFAMVLFGAGGMGARPDRDGLHCTPFPSNSTFGSIEILEALNPLLFWRKEMEADSGGAGRFRGGCGQQMLIQLLGDEPATVSFRADRVAHPALGLFGGQPGAPTRLQLFRGKPGHPVDLAGQAPSPVDPKGRTRLEPGDTLEVFFAGGGGYGSPSTRERARLQADLALGVVSPQAARAIYGVED